MSTPAITAFSHLSVQVRDIEACLPFYRDVFGLEVSVEREVSFTAPSASGEKATFRRREVYLRWENRPAASFIVLGQQYDTQPGGEATPLQGLGFDHVAFYVEDVHAVVSRARDVGAEVFVGPKDNDGPSYGYPGQASVRTALMFDPERNIIQIDQWL